MIRDNSRKNLLHKAGVEGPFLPGNAFISMTACCPVWLLMMISIPKRETPRACRSALEISRMTSSFGRSNTPSILSSYNGKRHITKGLWNSLFSGKIDFQKFPGAYPPNVIAENQWHETEKDTKGNCFHNSKSFLNWKFICFKASSSSSSYWCSYRSKAV